MTPIPVLQRLFIEDFELIKTPAPFGYGFGLGEYPVQDGWGLKRNGAVMFWIPLVDDTDIPSPLVFELLGILLDTYVNGVHIGYAHGREKFRDEFKTFMGLDR